MLTKQLSANRYFLAMVTWQSNLYTVGRLFQLSNHQFNAALPPGLGKMLAVAKFKSVHIKQSPAEPGDFKKNRIYTFCVL
jgi:hypothetical protein